MASTVYCPNDVRIVNTQRVRYHLSRLLLLFLVLPQLREAFLPKRRLRLLFTHGHLRHYYHWPLQAFGRCTSSTPDEAKDIIVVLNLVLVDYIIYS